MRFLRQLVFALLVLGLLATAAYVFRAPLLRGVASAWILHEPLAKADVIVVLGGGLETRPFEAARLYHLGLAPKILLMNPKPSPSTQLGLSPTEADSDRAILLKKEVPAGDIFIATDIVNSTYEESIAVRTWAKTNNIKRLIITTDFFHTRRARWVFCKELASTGIEVKVDAVPVRGFTTSDWWQHEQGIVAFQNEILKYAYYRLKY